MRSKCPTLTLSHLTSISSHYGSHSAMTWRWNNAVENYVLINRLLPHVQNTLWICAENILNSRLSILSKMAYWLRHWRGDVGRPPLWRICLFFLADYEEHSESKIHTSLDWNCSNSLGPSVGNDKSFLAKNKFRMVTYDQIKSFVKKKKKQIYTDLCYAYMG